MTSTAMDAGALARAYFARVSARDPEGMAGHWHDDFVLELVPLGLRLERAQAPSFFGGLFAAIPDLHTEVVRVTADGGVAALEWHMRGTFDGEPFTGIAATGRTVDMLGCDCLTWRDGRLERNTVYYDALDFARQAGMLPPRESGAERALYGAFNALTAVRRRISR